jgi:geranylgeranylglycerol-phosphate geranylgeranyltransferase
VDGFLFHMGFLKELFRLTRFEHALMLALAVLIAETVVLGHLPQPDLTILLSLLVPIFSEMGSFALNDYLDIETDRLNKKKDRPLVKGTISPKFALWFSVFSLLFSSVFAFLINIPSFVIALAFNLVAVLYNWKLKDLPLLGNAYIALTMAIPFIFGDYVVSTSLSPLALVLAALGFVAGLAREIVKSVQDMEGDIKARGSKTLPVIIGAGGSSALAILLYIAFIPLTIAPFYLGLAFKPVPTALVAIADLIILVICFKIAKKDYRFARNASLAAFFVGMVGILLAAILS